MATPQQLTGLFAAAHARHRSRHIATLVARLSDVQLPTALGAVVAAYLAPDQNEFSQLALVPSATGGPAFGGWSLTWNRRLTLTHPMFTSWDPVDGVLYQHAHNVNGDDLNDLALLAARVHDWEIDTETLPAERPGILTELPGILGEMLEHRFRVLAAAPILIA
jgi:hypothetical protein